MAQWELICDGDVWNVVDAFDVIDAVGILFERRDYALISATADCATVICDGRKFTVRRA